MISILDYINNDFKALKSSTSIEDVQNFFEDVSFSHFPVIEENIYIGSIAADDIDTFDSDKNISNYRYALEGFFVRTNMIWLDVLEVFAKHQSNVVPILDQENNYVGYYEISDIIKFFNETPFLKEKGSIIIVEKTMLAYSMGQIVQIVESNNGKLLGAFISETTSDTVQVTIKIALGGINEIIQTFRRYEYEIVSEHLDDNYLTNLKERAEYLDKYLNI